MDTKQFNESAHERISQQSNTRIEEMIWLAGCDDRKFKDMLQEMDESDVRAFFPKAMNDTDFSWDLKGEEFGDIFRYNGYYGILAEIHVPVLDHISFRKQKNGKEVVSSYSFSFAHCRIYYVYAESLAQITKQIENVWSDHVTMCVIDFKKRSK